MKIIVSQNNNRLDIEFHEGKVVDKYVVDKADELLASLDGFIKKRKIDITVLKKANLEFVNIGLLTERVIRAIIAGLRF